MLNDMEAEWNRLLEEARRRTQASGRGDVVDYLALRARNDAAREAGISWLMRATEELAGEAVRRGAPIKIERATSHRFAVGASTMIGERRTIRFGIRQMTVEAGYPRTPSDGIVRGGGLACARFSHYGAPRAGMDLLLVRARDAESAPQWFVVSEETRSLAPFVEADLRRHFRTLCDVK